MSESVVETAELRDLILGAYNVANKELNIVKYQEGYKRSVGLTANSHEILPFHPKALENELNDTREHLQKVEQNRYHQNQARLLKLMSQQPLPEVGDELKSLLVDENVGLKRQIHDSMNNIQELNRDIKSALEEDVRAREKFTSRADFISVALDKIDSLETELAHVNERMGNISHQTHETIDEKKDRLDQGKRKLADYNRVMDEKLDDIAETEFVIEDLENETLEGRRDLNALDKKYKKDLELSRLETPETEEEYFEFETFLERCKNMFGIESIQVESISLIHVTYKNHLNATLHITIDIMTNLIKDAIVTGPNIKVNDILKTAKKLRKEQGIQLLLIQVLARLR